MSWLSMMMLLAAAQPTSERPIDPVLELFSKYVSAGDPDAAGRLLSSDVEILSYFGGSFRRETLPVVISNFRGLSSQTTSDGQLAFDVCAGAATFMMAAEVKNGRIAKLVYGVGQTAPLPPPVPVSFASKVDRCKPPVRFVGGL